MEDNQSQKNAKEAVNSDFESEENTERKLLKEKRAKNTNCLEEVYPRLI